MRQWEDMHMGAKSEYKTSELLFVRGEKNPRVKRAVVGVARRKDDVFCIIAQAAPSRIQPFKTYYLHRDGLLWRSSLWKTGEFVSDTEAEVVLAAVKKDIRYECGM